MRRRQTTFPSDTGGSTEFEKDFSEFVGLTATMLAADSYLDMDILGLHARAQTHIYKREHYITLIPYIQNIQHVYITRAVHIYSSAHRTASSDDDDDADGGNDVGDGVC